MFRLTREKVESLADELVKRGELSEKEGRALVDDLIVRSKRPGRNWKSASRSKSPSPWRGSISQPVMKF